MQAHKENQELQSGEKVKQAKIAADAKADQDKLAQRDRELTAEFQLKQRAQQDEARLNRDKMQQEHDDFIFNARLNAEAKVVVAEIGAKADVKSKSIAANAGADPLNLGEMSDDGTPQAKPALEKLIEAVNTNMASLIQQNSELHANTLNTITAHQSAPRTARKNKDGTFTMTIGH